RRRWGPPGRQILLFLYGARDSPRRARRCHIFSSAAWLESTALTSLPMCKQACTNVPADFFRHHPVISCCPLFTARRQHGRWQKKTALQGGYHPSGRGNKERFNRDSAGTGHKG